MDIVERLLAPDRWFKNGGEWWSGSSEGHEGPNDAITEAATTIASLRVEVDRKNVEIEGLEFVADVIGNPDKQLCCNGQECGCEGATVGQYAAWFMHDYTARKQKGGEA